MKRNDKHAAAAPPQRRGWTAPKARRLATSEAEANPGLGADFELVPS